MALRNRRWRRPNRRRPRPAGRSYDGHEPFALGLVGKLVSIMKRAMPTTKRLAWVVDLRRCAQHKKLAAAQDGADNRRIAGGLLPAA
jgi:hypothetical protein